MKCSEAQDIFGMMWDLPTDDPKRLMLEQHIATCSECSSEFELWEESQFLLEELSDEWTEMASESVNRQVMDRIYNESPWLIQDQSKPFAVSGFARNRLAIWIVGCLILFFVSSILLITIEPSKSNIETIPTHGILPTGIAGSPGMDTYIIPALNSGIIEPFVVSMGPTHPFYWMILSIISVALALYSLRRLSRIRH
ncbi:anti-sigma factor [Paenibacillus sp. CMAA1364]